MRNSRSVSSELSNVGSAIDDNTILMRANINNVNLSRVINIVKNKLNFHDVYFTVKHENKNSISSQIIVEFLSAQIYIDLECINVQENKWSSDFNNNGYHYYYFSECDNTLEDFLYDEINMMMPEECKQRLRSSKLKRILYQ